MRKIHQLSERLCSKCSPIIATADPNEDHRYILRTQMRGDTGPVADISVPDRDLPAVCHLRGVREAESIAARDPCGAPRRGCRVE